MVSDAQVRVSLVEATSTSEADSAVMIGFRTGRVNLTSTFPGIIDSCAGRLCARLPRLHPM